MTIEYYDSKCECHSAEGPFCDETECRKPHHVCGDPNSPCDADCMGNAYSFLEGEVLENGDALFFVSFKGKTFGTFPTRVGAEEFLEVLRNGEDQE